MPLCLMCPEGNQPFFPKIRHLNNHIAQLHPTPVTQLAGPPQVSSTQCCICNKRFTTNAGLIAHQQVKQHYLSCPTCSKTFLAPEQLAQHQSDVHSPPSTVLNDINGPPPPAERGSAGKELNYDCHECERRFESPSELEKHKGSHRQFRCSKCDQFFPSLIDWNNHFKSEHPRFQCGACKAVFTSDPELASHGHHCSAVTRQTSSQSSGDKSASSSPVKNVSVLCELCNKGFKTHAGLQAHLAAKHSLAVKCGICQLACSSPTTLKRHVDMIHTCAMCQDGILRDARTLEDHMADHSHPVPCGKCGTKYRSEEERSLHFAALDNDHPTCVRCQCGFEDEPALQAHMVSVHPPSPRQSPRPHLKCAHCDEKFIVQATLDVHMAAVHSPVFECGVCHYTSSSLIDRDAHVAAAHSCPICKEGIFLDTDALEDHLDHHRAPYRCVPCGAAYTEQDQLLQHYKTSSKDIHPVCAKCDIGFEDDDTYNAHVEEVHPRIACDSCDGALFDQEDLPAHYLSSRNHPVCDKCGMGFRDQFDFADHGATEHPEAHCFLCQWQFDSPDSLHYHIRQFVSHPKCMDCDIRFADADAYQHHLFIIHRPRDDDSAVIPPQVIPEPTTHVQSSSPPLSSRGETYGAKWHSREKARPSQPSLSGHSSPKSQRAATESPFQTSSTARSRSSTLSVGQNSSRESQQWESLSRTVPLEDGQTAGGTPEFNHSPLSMLPAVGTPLMSSTQTIPSVDFRSPFSPRPEIPSLFPTVQGLDGNALVENNGDSDSDSAHSPKLISPAVELPDPGAASPSSTTSSWTTSILDPSMSLPIRATSPYRLDNGDQTGSWSTGPASLLATNDGRSVASVSVSPSTISPESAEISLSAPLSPEHPFLSLTHHALQSSSSRISHSPVSSPILSSTGLALGARGQRREVRFEDNIMSEPAWESQSDASSDISAVRHSYRVSRQRPRYIVPPIYPSIPPLHSASPPTRQMSDSKVPRLSSLRRGKGLNGKASRPPVNGFSTNAAPSYHCRACFKDPCDDLTTTTCGHLFCYKCISDAVMRDSRCPECHAPTLLYCLFRIDTSA